MKRELREQEGGRRLHSRQAGAAHTWHRRGRHVHGAGREAQHKNGDRRLVHAHAHGHALRASGEEKLLYSYLQLNSLLVDLLLPT